MMDDANFDNFVRCMGIKAVLLLIQTEGKEVTVDGDSPSAEFLAKIPRMLETLEGIVAYTEEISGGFDAKDIEMGIVRLLGKMAREYGQTNKRAKK